MPSPQIRLLSPEVANKIAAGEVVDRPASVVKELMENAQDAGAGSIEVQVVAGGTRLIAVTDDGGGMDRDNALMALERHATSKIRDVGDIEHIGTLGFRGEALAAIGSVSRFRLQTGIREAPGGTEILMVGGKLQDVRDCGCPPGTAIEVRDLFFNVPARRKFLRSPATELSHIRQYFMVHALAHPATALRLVVDNREVWRLPGGATLEDRIRDLFGAAYLADLKPIQWAGGEVAVSGYVGSPALARTDSSEQFIFVNGRPASAPLIHRALREAFQNLLPAARHPILFLFLALDPGEVDVNVHPTKREVRFRQSGAVRDGILAALRAALSGGGMPAVDGARPFSALSAAPAIRADGERQLHIENLPVTGIFRYPRMAGPEAAPAPVSSPADAAPAPAPAGAPSGPAAATPWSWCRIVGQVGGLYVLLETEDGLVVMDPHAAHERVLFEKFMQRFMRDEVASQSLLLPENVDLMPRDAQRVRDQLPLLRRMGFGIAEFGGDAFVVDALPAGLAGLSVRAFLSDLAGLLEAAGDRGARENARAESIAQAACKAAVKARDRLTLGEIEQLVVDLATAEMPYTCPHGRPTLIFMSFQEFRRKFGRE